MIKYVDYYNGNDANNGNTFQTAYQTIQKATSVTSGGDFVRIAKSPDPTLVDSLSNWTSGSRVITLSSAKTQLINDCETVWTVIAPATIAISTSRKNATNSNIISVGTSQTGKIAFQSGAALDLSAYQQISFWIRPSVASTPSGKVSIRLCSDISGNNALHTFFVPAMSGVNQYHAFTLDNGAALSSNVNSIAFYVESALPAATAFLVDNFNACKALNANDFISLNTLISKNSGNREDSVWYPICSISGATITLDNAPVNVTPTSNRGYFGTTTSGVPLYKRDTLRVAVTATNTNALFTISGSGFSPSSLLEVHGGFNTGTTGQDGGTFFDGQNGFGLGISSATKNYFKINNVHFCRAFDGIRIAGGLGVVISSGQYVGNANNGIEIITSCQEPILTNVFCCNNASDGLSLTATSRAIISGAVCNNNLGVGTVSVTSSAHNKFYDFMGCNNVGQGVNFFSAANFAFYGTNVFKSNTTNGIKFNTACSNNHFYNVTTSSNTTSAIDSAGADQCHNYFYNSTFNEATPVTFLAGSIGDYLNSIVFSNRNGNTDNAHTQYSKNWRIDADLTNAYTTGGIGWKISPTSASAVTSANPAMLNLGKFWVSTGNNVTIYAKVYRNSTGINAVLYNQGWSANLGESSVIATGATGVWEQLVLSIGAPTQSGVIEPQLLVYGGTSFSAWVDQDSISVTQ